MEQPLSRTVSAESTQSWQQLTTASGASAAGRKARSSEPETGGGNVERASVSLPPLGSKAIRQIPSRRPSKASDSSLFEYFGSVRSGSAIEESDATPTLEGSRGGLGQVNPLLLPEAFRLPRSDVDGAESNRLSFSSLYSIGSAIFANNRGHSWSGRSSVVGSEPEGALSDEAPGCKHAEQFTYAETDYVQSRWKEPLTPPPPQPRCLSRHRAKMAVWAQRCRLLNCSFPMSQHRRIQLRAPAPPRPTPLPHPHPASSHCLRSLAAHAAEQPRGASVGAQPRAAAPRAET